MRKSILAIAATCAILASGVSFAADYDYGAVDNHTYKTTGNYFNDNGLTLGNADNCAGQCHDGKSPGGDNITVDIGKSFNYDVRYAYLRTVPVWTMTAYSTKSKQVVIDGLFKVPKTV